MFKGSLIVLILIVGIFTSSVHAEELQTEKALVVLEQIASLPDSATSNKAAQRLSKKRAAKSAIYRFALTAAEGSLSGFVSPEDLKEALKILQTAVQFCADQKFGNKDGVASSAEMQKMWDFYQGNAGIEVLKEFLSES